MENEMICYNTDGSGLKGVAKKIFFPTSIEEVRNIINSNEDIVIRGSGSNRVGGCVPNNSVVVDMKKMNKVIFDFEKKIVSVESGATIKELNEKLKAIGFEFPIFADENTIGGMVAMNSSGYMGGYGKIKDWIEQIEFVSGKGELISVGKADLSDVCGMEGITGIITKVKLDVLPIQKGSFSILQSENIEEIWSIIRRLKLEKGVVILKFYSKFVSKLLGFPGKYNVIVGFNSDRGKIKGEKYNFLLNIIKKSYFYLYSQEYYYSDDPQFSFDKLKDFIIFLDRLEVPYFGDLDLGIIYPFFRDNDSKREDVTKMINRLNGKPGKYGIGLIRKDRLDKLEKRIIQRVKLKYDPFGKMNKEKVIDFIEDKRKIIKEIKKDEKIIKEIKKENVEDRLDEIIMVKEKIVDYEDTFKSEFVDNKREQIEKFAREISRAIIKKEEINEVGDVFLSDNLDRKQDKISKEEKDLINKIMLNKFDKDKGSKIVSENKKNKNES